MVEDSDNEKAAFQWSFLLALWVYVRTLLSDLLGFNRARNRLLGDLDITEKRVPGSGRDQTFLLSEKSSDMIPVIFFHGSPGNGMIWRWYLKNCLNYFRIIAVDRAGFGPMDKNKPELVLDMTALRELLDWASEQGKKPILVGHSLGAGIAAKLAADYPDKIKGLLLIAPSLDPALEKIHFIQRLFALPFISYLLSRSIRNSNYEMIQYPDFLNELSLQLENITCPVTILHNQKDGLVSYENVDYIKERCTKAASIDTISATSGGHFLQRTQKDAIIKALQSHVV